MELNFESLEAQKWNIPTDRTWRIDEKNGAICLVMMFTPRIMVITMSKTGHFSYFLLMTTKNQSQFGYNIVNAPERSYWIFFSENGKVW